MKKIIDRYAEGLSSLAEEQLLREWSAAPQTDEPQELAWAQLMRGISQAKESEPQQLWAPPVRTIPRFQRFKYTAIAASVALVLGTNTKKDKPKSPTSKHWPHLSSFLNKCKKPTNQ
jgi:hypothetical protein